MIGTKAVFFDLDETLFDHAYAARCALTSLRDRHEALLRRPLEELESEMRRSLEDVHAHVLRGALTADDARSERFRRLFTYCGAELPAHEVHAHSSYYRATYQQFRRPIPGAVALLESLHGKVTVGIVSNNLTEEQRDKMRVAGIDHLIDLLVTSEDAGAIKPDPEIFYEALRQAQCTPQEAVMVGDSWEADIAGARNAGIRAVWFNRNSLPCPTLGLATEIRAFDPVEEVVGILLQEESLR